MTLEENQHNVDMPLAGIQLALESQGAIVPSVWLKSASSLSDFSPSRWITAPKDLASV